MAPKVATDLHTVEEVEVTVVEVGAMVVEVIETEGLELVVEEVVAAAREMETGFAQAPAVVM